MSKDNQGATPNIQNVDMAGLLALLLESQAKNNAMQQKLLELEVKKKEATDAKEAEAAARIERDRKQLHEQMKLKIVNDETRWRNCPHTDQKGGSAIYPISNNPDTRLRGTCTRCGVFIQPEHVVVDANGKKTVVPQHPLYHKVLERDQALYAQFVPTTGY